MSEIADLRRCDIEVDGRRVHPLREPIAETMRLRAGSEATSAFPSFGSPKDRALLSRLARAKCQGPGKVIRVSSAKVIRGSA